jgi:DNA replication protein DnaC
MHTAATEFDDVLANHKKTVHFDWVSRLLEREIDARKERALTWRIKRAQFPRVTSLEQFDWDFNPDIDREKIMELATLEFVKKNEIALFLGRPGTGKTHLALAIGLKAVEQGYRVYCSSVKRLAAQILDARANSTLDKLFRRILSAQLWILDDWGVVSLNQLVAEEVFDLLDRRIGANALLLTSNRDVGEWPQVFHEPVIASAAIDRLFDTAHILTFNGKSYRLDGKICFTEFDLKTTKNENHN